MIFLLLLLSGARADEASTEPVWTPPTLMILAPTTQPLTGATPHSGRRKSDGLLLPTYEKPVTKRRVMVVGSALLGIVVAGALVDIVGPRR